MSFDRLVNRFYNVPLLWAILKAAEVVEEEGDFVVAVSGYVIRIGSLWRRVEERKRLTALAAAALHIARDDSKRRDAFARGDAGREKAYDIAAEAKVASMLKAVEGQLQRADLFDTRGMVTLEDLSKLLNVEVEELEKMSTEEIALLLLMKKPGVPPKAGGLCRLSSSNQASSDGLAKQVSLVKRGFGGNIAALIEGLKSAGVVPGHFWRYLDTAPPKVDWRGILKRYINDLGDIRRTWTRPHRRGLPYPGVRQSYALRRVYVLVDVSGSISDYELRQFIGEVLGMAEAAKEVVVAFWDVGVRHVETVRSHGDVERLSKIPGGGGTVIKPALQWAAAVRRPLDPVIVLTDGYWADDHDEEVRDALCKIRPIIATTGIAPRVPCNLPVVRVEL
jgi:hypothetical protein